MCAGGTRPGSIVAEVPADGYRLLGISICIDSKIAVLVGLEAVGGRHRHDVDGHAFTTGHRQSYKEECEHKRIGEKFSGHVRIGDG